MCSPSEAELLERHVQGDSSAFGQLVSHYQAALLRHARGLLGAGPAAEDVVQEAFLRLAQKPPDIATSDVLAAWLHKVVRNLAMDVMRSETRRRGRERAAASVEASTGGLEEVEAADTREAVERKLAALPLDQREVLVLRILGGKSYREIAEITGRKAGTIGWLISVGLKALSAELAPWVGRVGEGESPRLQETSPDPGRVRPHVQPNPDGGDLLSGELS